MEDFALKNPDDIKQELDILSDEMSNALYDFRRCEEFRKITFSQLTLTNKMEKNCSVAEAEKWAYTSNEYKTIIEGLLVAEKNYSIAKGKYSNLNAWIDLYRSWLVTNRELSR